MISPYYLVFRKVSPITKVPDLLLIESKFQEPPIEFAMTEKINQILSSFAPYYDFWNCRLYKLGDKDKDIYVGDNSYYLNAATGYYERFNRVFYLLSNQKYIMIKPIQ